MSRVLVVDDEPKLLKLVDTLFQGEGWSVTTATCAEEAEERLRADLYDLLVTDMRLPRRSGMDLLRTARQLQPEVQVVVMTAYGTVSSAVEAMKLGAFEYLQKPFELDELLLVARRALERGRLRQDNAYLRATASQQPGQALVAESQAMRDVRFALERLAPTDTTVLLHGESGTGKELVARWLHEHSPRGGRPLIRVNCPAIPKDLVESELYGHVRGAFTGAEAHRKGRFELAHGSTIFLDELGDLPLVQQGKLLHVLENRRYERVGSSEEVEVDVRVLAATNQDLVAKVAEGSFRQDLYYRLAVFPVSIPPLRHRLEDLPGLVNALVLRLGHRLARPALRAHDEILSQLETYSWPGNVRELRNVLERAAVLCEGDLIRAEDLPANLPRPRSPEGGASDLNQSVDEYKQGLILAALEAAEWRKGEAAKKLGISARAMSHYVQRFGLDDLR